MFTTFNDERIDEYLRTHSTEQDEALRRARERAASEDMPPVPHEVGAFLCLMVQIVRAHHVLEIGSGAGLSGIWIARGLPDEGRLTTIELDPVHRELANQAYQEALVAHSIDSLLGDALALLPSLPDHAFDIMFIDPAKAHLPQYLEPAIRLVRPGGLIIVDNVIWSGRVVDPHAVSIEDRSTKAFNDLLASDPRLHSMILPIGDGVSVSLVLAKPDTDGTPATAITK